MIREGSISHAAMESLIGRIGFAQSPAFGRFASAVLKPPYLKLYATRYSAALNPTTIRTLTWRGATLKNTTRSIFRSIALDRTGRCAPTPPKRRALRVPTWPLFSLELNPPSLVNAELFLSSRPSVEEANFFSSTSTIFGLELSAIVLALFR